jgi:hypothetical protein
LPIFVISSAIALVYLAEEGPTAAASVTEQALAEARAIGSIVQVVLALLQLVTIKCYQGDPAKAKGYCLELWALVRDTGSAFAAVFALLAFGVVACFGGEPGQGVRLIAATDMILRQRGVKWFTGASFEGDPTFMVYKQALETAQAQLGPAAFEAAWAEGQQMTLEQAIALATENESEDS